MSEVVTVTEMVDAGAIARQAILSYFEKSNVKERFPPRSLPQSVEVKVRKVIHSWNLDIPAEKYEKYIVNAMHLGWAPFTHTSYDLQVALSLFTFCALIFDDAMLVDPKAMQEFVPRFCDGKPQLAPVLGRLVEAANDLRSFLHEYGANTVHSALLMFANEEVWYGKGAKDLVLQPDAGGYIEYSRYKNGITEPFAFSIWPKAICNNTGEYIQAVPDILNFINYLNDLFSFYKESLDGDQDNYVNQYARVHSKSTQEAIDDLLGKTLLAMENARNILGEGEAREAWEGFASGYTHYHLYCPRYKLDKLVPEYF